MGNRYIFFKSLLKSAPQTQYENFQNSLKGLKNISISAQGGRSFAKDNESMQYIKHFLETIKGAAEKERENQSAFFQNLKHMDVESFKQQYYTGNKFEYLRFIKDLNEAQVGIEELTANVQEVQKRFKIIQTSKYSAEGREYTYQSKKTSRQETATFSKDKADELYKLHNMPAYRNVMSKALSICSNTITGSVNGKIANIITDKIIPALSNNGTFQNELTTLIENNHISIAGLKGLIINTALAIFHQSDFDIQQQTKETFQKYIDSHETLIKNALQQGLKNIPLDNFQDSKHTLQNLLKHAIENKSGLGQELIQLPVEEKQKLGRLAIGEELFKKLQTYNDTIKDDNNAIARAKGDLTRAIKDAIAKYQQFERENEKPKLTDDEINIIYNKIISNTVTTSSYRDEPSSKQLLEKAFEITEIKGSTMAEINGVVKTYIERSKNIDKIFFPGEVIQLKNDFSFTYHINELKPNDILSEEQLNSLIDLRQGITNFGQKFLERYNKLGKGQTSVQKAYQTYMTTLREIYSKRKELLDQFKDDNFKNEVNKVFQAFLTNVSVKEYQFYNNDIGYGAGSLGGQGKVVDAVPNLINMINTGLIGAPDAESIIVALLNSFPDSIIGTSYVEDIKNFLLAGAAMMLFDDGFTAGKKFLDTVKKELDGPQIASVHLMLLDTFYIPQSYVLQNIYENLLIIYSDLLSQFKALQDDTHMTTGTRATLQLHNDINIGMLNQHEYQGPTGWENMTKYAEKNVTISYFFMAGMLDILENLPGIVTT